MSFQAREARRPASRSKFGVTFYAPPLFPRQREVFVRESIGEAATEIEMVDARPADRTHAHRARRDVDVDLAPLSMRARSDTKSGEPGGRAIISRTVPA